MWAECTTTSPSGVMVEIGREGVHLGVRKGRLRLHGAVGGLGHPESDRKPAADGGGAEEKAPAREERRRWS